MSAKSPAKATLSPNLTRFGQSSFSTPTRIKGLVGSLIGKSSCSFSNSFSSNCSILFTLWFSNAIPNLNFVYFPSLVFF